MVMGNTSIAWVYIFLFSLSFRKSSPIPSRLLLATKQPHASLRLLFIFNPPTLIRLLTLPCHNPGIALALTLTSRMSPPMKRVSTKSTPAPSRLRVKKPLQDDEDDDASDRWMGLGQKIEAWCFHRAILWLLYEPLRVHSNVVVVVSRSVEACDDLAEARLSQAFSHPLHQRSQQRLLRCSER